MSLSSRRNEVARIAGEIASLRKRLAGEQKHLADENAKAMKAMDAMGRASSTSQLSTRARDLERHQKAAARYAKQAADLESQIAAKDKRLATARDSLEREEKSEQQRSDREAAKRRRTELDHIRALERERRAAMTPPVMPVPRELGADVTNPSPALRRFNDEYDVCLSFAGEQRSYVEMVATALKNAGYRVFYDQDDDIAAQQMWGRDLGDYLDYIYRLGSRYCVMFISAEYAAKAWTGHERKSAFARALTEDGEYVLPVRFDDTELPGLRPTTGYLDLREYAPATLVDAICKKLGKPAGATDEATQGG